MERVEIWSNEQVKHLEKIQELATTYRCHIHGLRLYATLSGWVCVECFDDSERGYDIEYLRPFDRVDINRSPESL